MKKLLNVCMKIVKVLIKVVAVLFVVYFWNLDQKLMAWAYTMVNKIFDEENRPTQF